MQDVLEQVPHFWRWFDTTQFSYHCVHVIRAKVFLIQKLLHFSQIVQRVCTLVLFIIIIIIVVIMMNVIRKCCFYRSLFGNFYRADDHWEVILLADVSQSRAFRQPVRRKSSQSFVLSGWGSMCQPYIESATALSDKHVSVVKNIYIYMWNCCLYVLIFQLSYFSPFFYNFNHEFVSKNLQFHPHFGKHAAALASLTLAVSACTTGI